MAESKKKKKTAISKESEVVTAKKEYFFPAYRKVIKAGTIEEAQLIIKGESNGE